MEKINFEKLSITLPEDLVKRMKTHCLENGKAVSGLIRVAVIKYLKKIDGRKK